MLEAQPGLTVVFDALFIVQQPSCGGSSLARPLGPGDRSRRDLVGSVSVITLFFSARPSYKS